MQAPQPKIDQTAVKARAQQILRLFWSQWEPHLRELLGFLDSPLVIMAVKSLGALMPAKPREGLHLVLSYLRGCKALPSAALQARVSEVIGLLPDEDVARWGGVLAWIVTGSP